MKRTIARLFKYQRIVKKLNKKGHERIFSTRLALEIGVSPSQVRKDFSLLAITGQKRGGYPTPYLLKRMDEIINPSPKQSIIIIGMGKVGHAIADRYLSRKERISVVAGFDIDPHIPAHPKLPIYQIEELTSFVRKRNIKVAVLCVPDHATKEMGHLLQEVGITGILNFTGVDLILSEEVWIKNINLSLYLKNIFYHIEHQSAQDEKVALRNENNSSRSRQNPTLQPQRGSTSISDLLQEGSL